MVLSDGGMDGPANNRAWDGDYQDFLSSIAAATRKGSLAVHVGIVQVRTPLELAQRVFCR